jgi:DNA-binding transcriptional regulator YiaG
MPNIASVLKDEIARVARKELRKSVDPLRRQVTAHRRDLAALKRENTELRRELAALGRASRRGDARAEAPAAGDARGMRFSAARLQALRGKLAVSAADFGTLIGVSGQTVYNWEQGKTRPRPQQLEKIAEVRGLGKREARRRLEQSAAA